MHHSLINDIHLHRSAASAGRAVAASGAGISAVLPNLRLDSSVISDIRDAVNAGRVVTVSKTNITYNGWSGCGYVITNPATGDGAYMISGGENGSQIPLLWIYAPLGILLLYWAVASVAVAALLVAFLAVSIAYIYGHLIIAYLIILDACGEKATNEYLKCIAEMVGWDIFFSSTSHLLEKIPSKAAKLLGKSVHIGALLYAIYEYYQCNMEITMTCEDSGGTQ